MKDKAFCRFERKEVNTQYYSCPNRFVSCEKCPKLRPRLRTPHPLKSKITSSPKDKRPERELFSDWDTYPFNITFQKNLNTGTITIRDCVYVQQDSELIDSLIETYKKEAKEDRDKGLEAFWGAVESLSRRRPGKWECLTDEEKNILGSARGGSIEAIQRLVIAHPGMVHLPFVADEIENLIRSVKFGVGKEIEGAKKLLEGFLPKRRNHKVTLRDEHLVGILNMIMRIANKNKRQASRMLLDYDPSIGEERLRKISVGIKNKNH